MSGRLGDFVIGSGVCGFVKCSVSGVLFSHALSGELKAVGIVNEAVEDGVGVGGVAEHGRVPLFLNGSCLTSRSLTRIISYLGTGLRC